MAQHGRDKLITQALGAGTLEVDHQLVVRAWDPQMRRWTGIGAQQARGRPLGELFPQTEGLEDTLRRIAQAIHSRRTARLEPREGAPLLPIPSPNGRRFAFQQQHLYIRPFTEGDQVSALLVLRDVTPFALWVQALRTGVDQFREDAEYARREADLDDLTGLLNRNAAERRVLHARDEVGGGTGVMLLDLDHFKRVNDTWGHPAGDKVLAETAARLMRRVRRTDVVARYGGEEFLVVLPGVSQEAGARVGRVLLRALRERPIAVPTPKGAHLLQITASAGFSWTGPGERFSLTAALARADQALYFAKEGGRDQLVCAEPP
ncbi:MAG: diguanylate cyclase [Deltaproteobacteria bacterium]|nr:diguanylate cyclase [Deltaproteobacteria bacterium]